MKVTYHRGQSLRSMLESAGVPKKDLAKAEKEIVKLNGLSSARNIADGTVLTFPTKLTIGDETIKLRKLTGDVGSRADVDRPTPRGGKPMGALGVYAFDDLRRGGRVDACGYPLDGAGGVLRDACGVRVTPRRRTAASGCGSSGCGDSIARPPRSSGGGRVDACGYPLNPYDRLTDACSTSILPRRRTSVAGCGEIEPRRRTTSSGCTGTVTTRPRRSYTGCGASGCG